MSKPAVMVQLDSPILTKDTKVEVTSTGELELRPEAPQRAVTTVGALVDAATQGFRETVFDPQKRAEFTTHATTLGAIEDARVGASDTLVEVSQPPSKEKVAAAVTAVMKHKSLLRDAAPVAFEQVVWPVLEQDAAHLAEVTEQKNRLEVRAHNLGVLQAHLRQRLYTGMQAVYKAADSSMQAHRSLGLALEPLTDLLTGAASQGVETKKGIQRAVAKALKDEPQTPAAPDTKPANAKDAAAKDSTPRG